MRWNGKRIVRWGHRNPNIAKALKEIVTGENYLWSLCESVTVMLLQNQNSFFIFFVYIFIHISANINKVKSNQIKYESIGLTFSHMILHTETNKLIYNWSFLFVVLHKPILLPSTFNNCFHLLYFHSCVLCLYSSTNHIYTCNGPIILMLCQCSAAIISRLWK